MPFKIKAVVDGTEREIELPSVPPGFVTEDVMQEEIKRRLKGRVTLDDLATNDELKKQVIEKLGIKPAGEPAKDLTGEQLEAAQKAWEAKFLAPARTELETARKTITGLRQRDLVSQILQAAGAVDVRKQLRTPIAGAKDAVPPIVNMVLPYFTYDEERGQWFVKNGDKIAFSAKPTADQPYKGVAEFFEEWAGDKDNVLFLEDQRQRGPNMSAAQQGGPAGSKNVRLSRADAADFQKYTAAKELAAKQGGEVEFTD